MLGHRWHANRIVNNAVSYATRVSEADAYSTLHRAIVAGELSPGERLVEEELAERQGEKRGAIRAALLRLEHDGLVVRERNRGARVRRVSTQEGVEILEARAALESVAAGYAALRRTDAEADELRALVADMERLHRAGELLAMSERNAELHRRILDISRHGVARDICARLHSQIVRFQFRTVLAPGRSSESLAEHTALVEAIAAGDRGRAQAAMQRHLGKVAEALVTVARVEHAA
jgi:DNA-binding GntR family transcriptional regulator